MAYLLLFITFVSKKIYKMYFFKWKPRSCVLVLCLPDAVLLPLTAQGRFRTLRSPPPTPLEALGSCQMLRKPQTIPGSWKKLPNISAQTLASRQFQPESLKLSARAAAEAARDSVLGGQIHRLRREGGGTALKVRVQASRSKSWSHGPRRRRAEARRRSKVGGGRRKLFLIQEEIKTNALGPEKEGV